MWWTDKRLVRWGSLQENRRITYTQSLAKISQPGQFIKLFDFGSFIIFIRRFLANGCFFSVCEILAFRRRTAICIIPVESALRLTSIPRKNCFRHKWIKTLSEFIKEKYTIYFGLPEAYLRVFNFLGMLLTQVNRVFCAKIILAAQTIIYLFIYFQIALRLIG